MTADYLLTAAAHRIAAQLAARSNPDLAGLPQTLCQALKVQEEAGEMAQAVIGVLGQNPRKGVTCDWEQVIAEAIDVAVTALVFAETVITDHGGEATLDDRLVFHLGRIQARAKAAGAPQITSETKGPGDAYELRKAETLRFLLDMHTAHDLPLPESVETIGPDLRLRLDLGGDRPEDVRRWAELLGAIIAEPREVNTLSGSRWVTMSAETPRSEDDSLFGWHVIEVRTMCHYRPAAMAVQREVAA